jgi:hypothetical protein
MPSCSECDQKYGKIETDLRLRLALGIDPNARESLGVPQRVHRSFNPAEARNANERRARQRQFEKLQNAVIPLNLVQRENILPKFGPFRDTPIEDLIPIGVPTLEWQAFGEKLVRGSAYVLERRYIDSRGQITIHPPMVEEDETAPLIRKAIRESGDRFDLGPGFNVGKGYYFKNQPTAGIFRPLSVFQFEIWGRVTIYSSVKG